MKALAAVIVLASSLPPSAAQQREPIIDMHMHALAADAQGPPPLAMCVPFPEYPVWDPAMPYRDLLVARNKKPPCADPIWSPTTDDEVMKQTLAIAERRNIVGVLSGPAARVAAWVKANPRRFIRGLTFQLGGKDTPSPATLRAMHARGELQVLGEVTNPYAGILPDDPRMEPYWALAEELDMPVGIHIGSIPPGGIYLGAVQYRARMNSAFTIEEVVVKHPKVRVYIMHAGYPMIDDLLAVLYAHPQVYVDVGIIVYNLQRPAFYRYLQRIVQAGFINRIMFGSDQMVWPGTIERRSPSSTRRRSCRISRSVTSSTTTPRASCVSAKKTSRGINRSKAGPEKFAKGLPTASNGSESPSALGRSKPVRAGRPARIIHEDRVALTPGTRLGVYEVTAQLGVGGMGEVYRATDTKLKRQVAIKILPSSLAADADRLARFQREAEVLASLNHPNITAIYGLEDVDGQKALVMELVEGEDLAQRITRGAIPLAEALPIAKQIADALGVAHEQGIIHRDLKPANVKVRDDGTVKVLDFGLAKAMELTAPAPNVSQSPTLTSPAMTQMGIILGTAAYMAPEQAKGKRVDKRADIWAFGCVLYEMLTGKRAFEGEDLSDIFATVLKSEPDWTALPADVPASIRTLVMRCLEKDRTRRVADTAAAQFVLDEQNSPGPSSTIAALPLQMTPLWRRAVTATAAVVVGAAVASGAWWSVRPSTPLRTVTRFTLALAAGQQFTNPGRQVLAISPDGTRVVYVANRRLYLRPMNETEARPIVGTENETGVGHPVFSPDGQSVAFFSGADQTLKRIAVSGGAAVTICQADNPFGMSWGADGILFGQGPKGIMRVSPNGGKPDLLVSLNAGEFAHGPQMLPDGQAVLFTLATGGITERWDNAHIVVQSLKSGERQTLIDGGSDGRYLPTGHLVYALGGTLFAVPLNVRRLEVTGGPSPVVEGVRRADNATGTAHFSSSNSGSLIFVAGPAGVSRRLRVFVVADRSGTTDPLNLPPGAYAHPRVSPDGTRLAFGTDDDKEANIWIYELSGVVAPRRITFSGRNRFPVWSGDGQRVAFQSDRDGDLGIFLQRADGAGDAQRLTKGEQGAAHVPESWSRDGKHLLFTIAQGSTVTLWTFALDERKATPFGDVRSRQPIAATFSPDGRWVAYAASEGITRSAGGVFAQPFPATGARYQIPRLDFDYHPIWNADGKELFYIPAAGRFAAVSVQTQPSFAFGNPVEAKAIAFTQGIRFGDVRNYDITPAGKFVAHVDPREPGASGTSAAPEIQVVLDWFEELKRLVPTK